jgi:hypothetical protein
MPIKKIISTSGKAYYRTSDGKFSSKSKYLSQLASSRLRYGGKFVSKSVEKFLIERVEQGAGVNLRNGVDLKTRFPDLLSVIKEQNIVDWAKSGKDYESSFFDAQSRIQGTLNAGGEFFFIKDGIAYQGKDALMQLNQFEKQQIQNFEGNSPIVRHKIYTGFDVVNGKLVQTMTIKAEESFFASTD